MYLIIILRLKIANLSSLIIVIIIILIKIQVINLFQNINNNNTMISFHI
jgi:hypothetical protein